MTYGTVKYFDKARGYGLIACDGGHGEILVHQAEVDRAKLGQLAARQKLGFDITERDSRPAAVNLWATFGNR